MGKLNLTTLFSLLIFFLLFQGSAAVSYVAAQGEIHLDDRDNYAKKAKNHFQSGNWSEGKKAVDEGLKLYPKDSDLHMLLGRYHHEQKNYDAARQSLIQSLKYNKNNVEAKQILVNVETETQRYSSAICYINELLEVNPYWKGLWRKKIDVYRLQGNQVEANRLLKRISQIYPDDKSIKDAYLHYVEQEAIAKKSEGKMNEAISLGSDLIEKDPNNEDFYLELINNYLKVGDYEKALNNAERGLYNLPKSVNLVNKKLDILSAQNRYDEILTYLQQKINEGVGTGQLESRYSYFLEEAARNSRKRDPYTLYKTLFDRNPRNEEAFNYVVSTAAANGLYEDAIEAIKTVKGIKGETKELLSKEQMVYERMGEQSKVNQIRVRLYQLYPEDEDVKYQYTLYRLQQAKADMADGLYDKAINHWRFIAEFGDEEQRKAALISIYNCSFQQSLFAEAHNVLDMLKQNYPDELEWGAKKASVYGKEGKYREALTEYEQVISKTDPLDKERILIGYDELATVYTKQLIEGYLFKDALPLIDRWLRVNPQSDMAIRYGINVSAQMKDYDLMMKYASLGLRYKPEDTFFKMKLGEAHNIQKDHKQSLEILTAEIEKNPYHKELIGTHSQSYEDYARELIKELKYDESLKVLNNALRYDPDNKSLKYWKGVTFEKLNMNDSAYYYQSFYDPSIMELKDFKGHLDYLKNKTYKNKVTINYLRSRFGDIDQITSIATLEYFRFETKDTYAGRVNYTGRDEGKGIQGQAEWNRHWKPDISTRADIALANRYFSKFALNASVYKAFKYDWEAELGAGFKRMADKNNLVNVVAGLSKSLDSWWLNARFNSIILDSDYYYSLSAQGRFYLNNPRNYITGMFSVGSAPDVDIIDNQLYNGFSVTNSMVGAGVYHLISNTLTAGVLCTWYNYEDFTDHYRNLYNLYFQLHVNF